MKSYFNLKANFFNVLLFFSILLISSGSQFWAQCRGVKITSATLNVLDRPCGPTPTGSLELVIKGGLAPFTLAWTVDNIQDSLLPQSLKTNQLVIDSLKGAFKPGYQVRVKDACGNEASSATIQLVYAVPIRFASAPQVINQPSENGVPNTGILVEVIGGISPRTLIATDTKGKSYSQQSEVGPPVNGKYKYQIASLPDEKYKIEVMSGSKKCTQVWKESIELKALEK